VGDLLSLRDVCKGYARGDRRVLVDVSLALGRGDIGAIVASRYEGKTTLLKVAAGMVRPDQGEVLVGETNLARCSSREREALLGREVLWVNREGPGVDFKVRDYIAMPLVMARRCGPHDTRLLAAEALERLEILHCADRRWWDLSNWEQLLVQFARVFAAKPQLLVMDDLVDGFSMRKARDVGDILRSLVEEVGCAVLLSTENFDAALVAERVWSLRRGRLEVMSDLIGPDAEVIDFPGGPRGGPDVRSVGS
jgi:ABC-type cobalamin/Fe3+-siderophores transport system ATPase subunit